MKSQFTKILTVLLLLLPVIMGATNRETLPTKSGSVLKDGYIYTVSKTVEIAGTDSLPVPLTVDDDATATIYIPAGVTLKVTGNSASGTSHASAGIRVPAGATLIITGEGTLFAYGGKGAAGGDGGNGGNGYVVKDDDKGYPGAGGYGGYGGGGCAAAIGGNGGNGHGIQAGPTKAGVWCEPDDENRQSGNNGSNTQDGEDGEAMGTVYILGTVKVYASSGAASSQGGAAGATGSNGDDHGTGWKNNYSAGGGGAGGGGGSGYAAACGIGGGGAGGQCGATGGTGGNYWKDGTGDGWAYLHGGSGVGGLGAADGGYCGNTRTGYKGYYGGLGGSATEAKYTGGDEGNLYVAAKGNFIADGSRNNTGIATGHDAIKATVELDANMEGTATGTTSMTMYYGVKPESVTIPSKEGQFFMGYYTSATGGERIYDETGKAVAVYTDSVKGTLYGQWSDTHITSQEQFVKFCNGVSDGSIITSNATYYLETDIQLDSLVSVGNSTNYFAGTFDGQGHTISLNIKTDNNYAAVFAFVQGGTIKDLIVTGTIQSSGRYASGIVGRAAGVTIENCLSSVDIVSTYSGDVTNGGLIAVCSEVENTTFTITNSAYVGKFYGSESTSWGGLVGYSSVSGSITSSYVGNALGHDDDLPSATACDAIVRYSASKGVSFKLTSTYCSSLFTDNGWTNNTSATTFAQDNISDGTLCYKLDGNSSNGAWRQTIGEDSCPVLDDTHGKVFYDYSSAKGTTVPRNRSYLELTSDMRFETDYTPNGNTQIYAVYESRGTNNSDNPTSVVQDYGKVYTYLYNSGTVTVDDISDASTCIYSGAFSLNALPLYEQSDCRLYELTIMENGVVIHHFLPYIYNKVKGMFDTIERKQYDISGAEVFIDQTGIPCQHTYTVEEYKDGKSGAHCYLCDETTKPTYYVYAIYDGSGATGTMNSELIELGGALSKNQYLRKDYLFLCWMAYNKKGELISNVVYEDESRYLNIGSEFCDTITFKAIWKKAFSYNGNSYIIETANTKDIKIVDDGENGFSAAEDFTAAAISYTRPMPSGAHWGSLCLPFAISESDTVYLFKTGRITQEETTGETITLTRCKTVDAGEPCMFYRTVVNSDSVTFQATNAAVQTTVKEGGDENLTFTGVLERNAFKCDTESYAYYGVQQDVFYNVGTSYVVNPYHTYMSLPVSAGAKVEYPIAIDEMPMAVQEIECGEWENGKSSVYNISGQRVSDSYRGVVIKNGKKMLNR